MIPQPFASIQLLPLQRIPRFVLQIAFWGIWAYAAWRFFDLLTPLQMAFWRSLAFAGAFGNGWIDITTINERKSRMLRGENIAAPPLKPKWKWLITMSAIWIIVIAICYLLFHGPFFPAMFVQMTSIFAKAFLTDLMT